MYEIGKVYLWRNQVGPMACLNGEECTVLAKVVLVRDYSTGKFVSGQLTDSKITVEGRVHVTYAEKGDLIPKNPPKGEQSILSLFDQPVLETA